jgi:hypothetical protein
VLCWQSHAPNQSAIFGFEKYRPGRRYWSQNDTRANRNSILEWIYPVSEVFHVLVSSRRMSDRGVTSQFRGVTGLHKLTCYFAEHCLAYPLHELTSQFVECIRVPCTLTCPFMHAHICLHEWACKRTQLAIIIVLNLSIYRKTHSRSLSLIDKYEAPRVRS